MKRMLDQKTIDELQALLSKISVDDYDIINIEGLRVGTLEVNEDYGGTGEIYIQNLGYIVDTDENQLFPFSENAGKVLAVNEDEDGLVAVEKGTKLYKHEILATNSDSTKSYTAIIISTKGDLLSLAQSNEIISITYASDMIGGSNILAPTAYVQYSLLDEKYSLSITGYLEDDEVWITDLIVAETITDNITPL